jgi:predicted alpha-1,6-mannanase (GH76 family)
MDELDHAGNGRPGVEKGEAVVVLAAAVGEHRGVVASAEQAPHRDGFVLRAGSGDQLVRLAFDKLLRVGSLLIGQCSWSRRAPRAQQKGPRSSPAGHAVSISSFERFEMSVQNTSSGVVPLSHRAASHSRGLPAHDSVALSARRSSELNHRGCALR